MTEKTLKVLHVSQPPDSGVPRVVAGLVADQVTRGWDVVVATPDDSELGGMVTGLGARSRSWQATRTPGAGTLGEARALDRIVQEENPDIVHLHSAKAGLAGRLVLRGRLPTVFEPNAWSFEPLRGMLRWAAVAWERRAARWTDLLICVSAMERAIGVAADIDAPFEVVPNGVDLSAWPAPGPAARATARLDLGLNENALVVVCVGRLSEQKGQDVLLEAWRLLLREIPEASLVLVGDGPYRERLQASKTPNVSFMGTRDDVRSWFVAADVAVISSRWEGMSIGMLEAMATARSVVSTRVAGAEDALGGGAGAIVEVEDPAGLAQALVARLRDPELAGHEGVRARERVQERFDSKMTAARVAELYELVLQRRATYR